jgi:chromate transporter
MLDGLGMAETTPGPLIMVVQFVAYLGAYRHPGPLSPMAAGILGSAVTTWVTFVPCFYWIFLGAPYIERLRGNRQLTAALSTITAAVVGVVLNLAVWFAIHTLFAKVATRHYGPIKLEIPEWSTLNWGAAVIAVLAMLLTFRYHKGMVLTLSVCAVLGTVWYLAAR